MKNLLFYIPFLFLIGCSASGTTTFTSQNTSVPEPAVSGGAQGRILESVDHYVPADPTAGITSTGEVVNAPTPVDTLKNTGSTVTNPVRKVPPASMTFTKKSFALWGADAVSPQGDSTHVTFNEFDHSFAWNFHGHTLSIRAAERNCCQRYGNVDFGSNRSCSLHCRHWNRRSGWKDD